VYCEDLLYDVNMMAKMVAEDATSVPATATKAEGWCSRPEVRFMPKSEEMAVPQLIEKVPMESTSV
jgi:hypothetical protein